MDKTKNLKDGKSFIFKHANIFKHCLACILLILTSSSMYFRKNLKMKKPTYCFTWIVFIELINVLISIRKTWNSEFVGNVGSGRKGGWGIFRNGGG